MSIDVLAIGNQVTEYPEASNQQFETMYEYLKITQRLVRKLAPMYRAGLAEQILKSEDAISNIATQIMMADWRWNGHGTIHGYRKECAKWAIQGFIERDVSRSKRKTLSLNHITSSVDNSQEYIDMIPGKDEDPSNLAADTEVRNVTNDLIHRILDSGVLTPIQRRCIELRYLEDMSMSEIGRMFGVSRQAVQDNIKRGITKLREIVNESNQKRPGDRTSGGTSHRELAKETSV